jgi:hypothetical protein
VRINPKSVHSGLENMLAALSSTILHIVVMNGVILSYKKDDQKKKELLLNYSKV